MDKLKGTRRIESTGSPFNALSFLIETKVKGLINTALPVIVISADASGSEAAVGYVTVKPLIAQTDAYSNILLPPDIAKLPFCRYQGGIAAIVIDPQPGDIGLAVFAQSDCSALQQEASEPVQPGSFRSFSMADGFYIGGFINKAPEIWLELTQDNVATLHAPDKIILETKNAEINAKESVKIKCKTAEIKAEQLAKIETVQVSVKASATLNIEAAAINIKGNMTLTGTANVSGIITGANFAAGAVTLLTHVHAGVTPGPSVTGPAQ